MLVTESVVRRIEELADLAPLHNPASVQGIRVATELFPDKPQVVVFDTAFHQTLPDYAFHYAIPYEYYEKYRIRRYGFHGTSHHFVTLQAAKLIGKPFDEAQFISAHLGNGCSAAAIRNGRSVDTTMGLTPLEGLMMGTRSGDVDPSLHLYLQEKEQRSLRDITEEILTRRSGLLGISGVSHDMRSVIAAADEGNQRARLAIEMFCYRLARSILGLTASLSSIDALIFTGGIGENSAPVRARVLTHLAILHPELDQNLNENHGKGADGRITSRSGLLCLVIATNEELMIARETALLIRMRHAFFLAPAGSGVGLTTVALGLVSALDRKGVRVAFFKPIAQETEGDSGPERSTHFIRATTALQPADPIPLATATKTISERGMDELMSQVIGAYGASTESADMVVVEGLLPALSDSYLGVVNHELVATLNAEVILVASQAHKSIEQLDDQIEYAAKAFGGLEKILGVIINRYPVDKPPTVGKFDRKGPIGEQALSASGNSN